MAPRTPTAGGGDPLPHPTSAWPLLNCHRYWDTTCDAVGIPVFLNLLRWRPYEQDTVDSPGLLQHQVYQSEVTDRQTHIHNHHHHNHFTALFFRDQPGEPVPEENFWTLWCKGRLTEADTLTIQLGATPSGLTSAHLHHPLIFLQAGCPSCRPTNSVIALKASSAFRLGRRR